MLENFTSDDIGPDDDLIITREVDENGVHRTTSITLIKRPSARASDERHLPPPC